MLILTLISGCWVNRGRGLPASNIDDPNEDVPPDTGACDDEEDDNSGECDPDDDSGSCWDPPDIGW